MLVIYHVKMPNIYVVYRWSNVKIREQLEGITREKFTTINY